MTMFLGSLFQAAYGRIFFRDKEVEPSVSQWQLEIPSKNVHNADLLKNQPAVVCTWRITGTKISWVRCLGSKWNTAAPHEETRGISKAEHAYIHHLRRGHNLVADPLSMVICIYFHDKFLVFPMDVVVKFLVFPMDNVVNLGTYESVIGLWIGQRSRKLKLRELGLSAVSSLGLWKLWKRRPIPIMDCSLEKGCPFGGSQYHTWVP